MNKFKVRAKLVENSREVKGWYCPVEDKHYVIFDDAELRPLEASVDMGIDGFLEVDPETVELI